MRASSPFRPPRWRPAPTPATRSSGSRTPPSFWRGSSSSVRARSGAHIPLDRPRHDSQLRPGYRFALIDQALAPSLHASPASCRYTRAAAARPRRRHQRRGRAHPHRPIRPRPRRVGREHRAHRASHHRSDAQPRLRITAVLNPSGAALPSATHGHGPRLPGPASIRLEVRRRRRIGTCSAAERGHRGVAAGTLSGVMQQRFLWLPESE